MTNLEEIWEETRTIAFKAAHKKATAESFVVKMGCIFSGMDQHEPCKETASIWHIIYTRCITWICEMDDKYLENERIKK